MVKPPELSVGVSLKDQSEETQTAKNKLKKKKKYQKLEAAMLCDSEIIKEESEE